MTTRTSPLLFAVAALVFAGPVAHAAGNWTMGVNGGVSKPTGDLGKDLKVGPVAGIDICMHVNDRFAVGAEGSWTQSSHKDVGVVEQLGGGDTYTLNEDKLVNISGGIHGKYTFAVGESRIAPRASAARWAPALSTRRPSRSGSACRRSTTSSPSTPAVLRPGRPPRSSSTRSAPE